MNKRPRCELFGCVCAEDYPACHRCGADLYEDFIQEGRLEFLFRAYWRAQKFVWRVTGKKCEVCQRRFWGRGRVCSDECFEKWLPF